MKKNIALLIAGTSIGFTMTTEDYNGYLNEIMPDNKVAPAHNLVMRTVEADSKEALRGILDTSPGASMQIAGLLTQEFAPSIEISVKK
ncbi:putative phage tail assembly chaperone [Shewanella psychrotolerans]|uniref:putative phage tail assembly chaperone n=1 Tax=Shewanella psychrotolerans TaxID=2864206 RepID=UPI001C65FC77|nr:putative phage tail assembly chaperone [Shewanella psychrotolerans]QYK02447.1 putative phage tail assembly chaperone [Shewanella psychrotolerans]